MAEAAEGAHDDCVMSLAIGIFISQSLHMTERETVDETRRRLTEESARLSDRRRQEKHPITPQTTDVTAAELFGQADPYDADPHLV